MLLFDIYFWIIVVIAAILIHVALPVEGLLYIGFIILCIVIGIHKFK